MTATPSSTEFLICVLGVYACFLTWGILQERVSTTPYGEKNERFRFFVTLNTLQSAIATFVAYLYLKLRNQNAGKPSFALIKEYAKAAFLNCISSPFGYMSLRHIDYPTMILGKSCKLVPVMFMNVVLYGKSFPFYKYATVGFITIGVSGFMLLQPGKSSSGENSMYGLALLTVNLLIDGATNSIQDQIFHRHRTSGTHMMLFMNLLACLFTSLWLVLDPAGTNEIADVTAFCRTHSSVLSDLVLFGICGALGQIFVFHIIQRFGSLRLVTVTVTRKLFTMLLSVFYFGHQLTIGQWTSVALVFFGIGLEAYVKSESRAATTVFVDPVAKVQEKKRT